MSEIELARRIFMSPANIHKIFKGSSVDSHLLYKLGIILDCNFFKIYNHNDMPGNYLSMSKALYWKNVFSYHENELKLICAELRRRRIEKGYSLDSIAKALGIPKRRLYKIESGTYPYVSPTYFWVLGALYGASPKEILSVIPGFRFKDVDYLNKRYSLE